MASLWLTDFQSIDWQPGGHPLEQKKVGVDPQVIGLRFEPGFADPHWCERSHILFVEHGELTLEFEHETIVVGSGQACRLTAGTRHRAMNRGSVAVEMRVVSDLTA